MTEEQNVKKQEQPETESASSAGTEKTGEREGYIPRDRFDTLNEKAGKLETEIEQLKKKIAKN